MMRRQLVWSDRTSARFTVKPVNIVICAKVKTPMSTMTHLFLRQIAIVRKEMTSATKKAEITVTIPWLSRHLLPGGCQREYAGRTIAGIAL